MFKIKFDKIESILIAGRSDAVAYSSFIFVRGKNSPPPTATFKHSFLFFTLPLRWREKKRKDNKMIVQKVTDSI